MFKFASSASLASRAAGCDSEHVQVRSATRLRAGEGVAAAACAVAACAVAACAVAACAVADLSTAADRRCPPGGEVLSAIQKLFAAPSGYVRGRGAEEGPRGWGGIHAFGISVDLHGPGRAGPGAHSR